MIASVFAAASVTSQVAFVGLATTGDEGGSTSVHYTDSTTIIVAIIGAVATIATALVSKFIEDVRQRRSRRDDSDYLALENDELEAKNERLIRENQQLRDELHDLRTQIIGPIPHRRRPPQPRKKK